MNFSTDTALKYVELRKAQLDKCWHWLSTALEWTPGDLVLDVGCGTGSFTKLLVDRGNIKSITGYDKSPEYIEVARKENLEAGKTFYEVADATNGATMKPEWKGCFSKAISIAVFQFIDDKTAFFTNVCDCLQPGGYFLMRFHHGNEIATLEAIYRYMSDHPRWKPLTKDFSYDVYYDMLYRGSAQQLEQLVIDCGFSEARVVERNYYNYGTCTEEDFKHYFEVQLEQVKHIPEHMKTEFVNDAYRKLVDINERDREGRMCFKSPTWILTAKK